MSGDDARRDESGPIVGYVVTMAALALMLMI
jgi:hypothetical protein